MAITPNDIHNKDFSTKFKGFDPEEVNDFLEEVKKELETLIRDNKDLEKRVKFNEEKVEYFNSIQETLNKSILVAKKQRTAYVKTHVKTLKLSCLKLKKQHKQC